MQFFESLRCRKKVWDTRTKALGRLPNRSKLDHISLEHLMEWTGRELEPFEEYLGREFLGCGFREDSAFFAAFRRVDILLLPISALKSLQKIPVGSKVAILRTDDDAQPIKIRRI